MTSVVPGVNNFKTINLPTRLIVFSIRAVLDGKNLKIDVHSRAGLGDLAR